MTRILVVTTEPLPIAGQPTTGAGLRAYGLAEGLRARGLDVVLATVAPIGDHPPTTIPPHVRIVRRGELAQALNEIQPSSVVLQHWGLARELPELTVPLAIDLAGPHLLERLYWGSADTRRDVSEKLAALRRADFLVCSGEFQRHYFYPFLAMAGYDLRTFDFPVIPFSVPTASVIPANASPREPGSFVFGGTFLAWQDPAKPIGWLLDEMDLAQSGKLYFYGGSHPVADASGGKFSALAEKLRSHPRVEMKGFVGFDQLLSEYQNYEVALDLMERNPERELAYTTRTMIYLRCGLPVIYNDYSEISAIVSNRKCGWALSPDDEQGFRAAVRDILTGRAPLSAMRTAALAVADEHSWHKTIEPLASFCAEPRMREAKTATLLAVESQLHEADALGAELEATRAHLATLRGKFLVRLQDRLPAFGVLLAPLAWLAAWPAAAFLWLRFRGTTK
ncbi:MAG: glycosyltransferase family 4 protein [Candidatus Sumerlaeaceae bacterium]|nr:glycosyltransferase family 4 protein [Candidatus Sumerlaeaceae bacterium]